MFRIICGCVCVLLSTIFLVANTAILGRYGWRSGTDEFEAIVNTAVAGSVPLALAMMPFFLMITWIPGRYVPGKEGKQRWRRGRPNPMVIVGFALYCVFVAFNFMGAIGSIALQKTEYVDKRESGIDDAKRAREARARKVAELERIKVERPPSAVQADIDGAKVHRFWQQTSECTDARSRGHSKFCGSVAGWKRELGLAEEADKLRREIDELDRRISAPSAQIASADPQSETLATYATMIAGTAVSPRQVRLVQPLVWFLLLELSCMFMFFMSLRFFRLGHSSIMDEPAHVSPPQWLPSPERASVPPSTATEPIPLVTLPIASVDPALQAELCARFWSECTRPMPASMVPLANAFMRYRDYTERAGVPAYDLAEFQRRAASRVAGTSTIGETRFLVGIVLAEQMGAV